MIITFIRFLNQFSLSVRATVKLSTNLNSRFNAAKLKTSLKGEYQSNAKYENPLKLCEKNSLCWSTVNVSNNGKKILYNTSFFLNTI